MSIDDTQRIKEWIIHELEPICEADLPVLADYIIGLLKEKGDKQVYIDQLEEFLQSETKNFVDKLLETLETKSYLDKPSQTQEENTHKRKRDEENNIVDQRLHEHKYSPNGQDRKRRRNDDYSDRKYRRSPRERSRSRERVRERSRERSSDKRDYRNHRDSYDYGSSDRYQNDNISSQETEGYNPEKPMFEQFGRGRDRGRGNRMFDRRGTKSSYEKYDTRGKRMYKQDESITLVSGGKVQSQERFGGMEHLEDEQMFVQKSSHDTTKFEPDQSPTVIDTTKHAVQKEKKGGRPLSTTLLVSNIPPELNTIKKLNSHFERFGSIVNITIKKAAHKAFVKFGSVEAAQAAWSSPEAVLGNRFIKVFWAKPRREDLQKEEPSTEVVKPNTTTFPPPVIPSKDEKLQLLAKINKQKEELLEKQLKQYKEMVNSLSKIKNTNTAEKLEILKKIKQLEQELSKAVSEQKQTITQVTEATKQKLSSLQEMQHKTEEDLKKEMLDRQLDMIAQAKKKEKEKEMIEQELKTKPIPTEEAKSTSDKPSSTDQFSSKSSEQPSEFGRGRGRLRGRGRGAWGRGRGARWTHTLRVDNRTSTIIIKNIPESKRSEQALRDHFKGYGEIISINIEGENKDTAVIQFDTRKNAEKAIINGKVMDGVTLQIAWKIEKPQQHIKKQPPQQTPVESPSKPQQEGEVVEEIVHYRENDRYEDDDDSDKETSWKR